MAAAALAALTSFAWTVPGLHRLELYVEPWNVASTRAAERAGYQREGLLRRYLEIGGRRVDMLLYALVDEPGDSSGRPTRSSRELRSPRRAST